jgi:hypothetical protein
MDRQQERLHRLPNPSVRIWGIVTDREKSYASGKPPAFIAFTLNIFYCFFYLKNAFFYVAPRRLSPLYLMVGLLSEIFTSYIVDVSKFWVHERSDLNCQRYAWSRASLKLSGSRGALLAR